MEKKILWLMRFNSIKKGSFERLMIYLSMYVKFYKFVFVFEEERPQEWLKNELIKYGACYETSNFKPKIRNFIRLSKLIKKYNPDLVHFHFFSALSPFIPYVKLFHNVNTIYHIHNLSYGINDPKNIKTTTNKIIFKIKHPIQPLRKKIFVASIDKMIAVSNFIKKETSNYLNYYGNKAIVVYNGVYIQNAHYTYLRKELNLNQNKVIIFSCAWLTYVKGMAVLLKSSENLINKNVKNIAIVIAGEGPELINLKKLVKDLDLSSYVHFLGNRNDIPELLNQVDIVVAPSIWPDPCPYFVLESLSAGKVTIGSRIGGISELLSYDKDVGVLFEPSNHKDLARSIIHILSNNNLKKKIENNALKLGKSVFNLSNQVKEIEQIYSDLIGS